MKAWKREKPRGGKRRTFQERDCGGWGAEAVPPPSSNFGPRSSFQGLKPYEVRTAAFPATTP
jgi:hypothetical protein